MLKATNDDSPVPLSSLELKAKTTFPAYDETAKDNKVELGTIQKRSKKGKWKKTWKKFQEDITTASSNVRAVGSTVNGYPLNQNQVVWFAENFHLRLRPSTHYWYDSESGFFGKMGGINKAHLDPNIPILGTLDPKSSAGNTTIHVNGRELLQEELSNWKQCGISLLPGKTYRVDPVGNVMEDDTFLCNWKKKFNGMLKTNAMVAGGAVLGAALLGGVMGMDGGMMGMDGGMMGGGGGGDNFWSSSSTGATSNFDSSGAGYVSFADGSSVTIGM